MKKYGLLMVIVLAMSTAAWAGPFACVMVPRCVPACEEVKIHVKACLPFDCDDEPCIRVCRRGGFVLVDILYDCDDCCCGGATCVDGCVDIGEFCPGRYIVIVRIYCQCGGPCCYMPRVCAMGSASFTARCATRAP